MAKKDSITGNWSGNSTGSYASLVIPGGKYSAFYESWALTGKERKAWNKAVFFATTEDDYTYDKKRDEIFGTFKFNKSKLLNESDMPGGYWNVINGKMQVNMKNGKFKLWSDEGSLVGKGKLKSPQESFPLMSNSSCFDVYPYIKDLDKWQQETLCDMYGFSS